MAGTSMEVNQMKSISTRMYGLPGRLVLTCLALWYQSTSLATYQELSFDTLFPVTLYKNALDESIAICADLQVLQENQAPRTSQDCIDQRLYLDVTTGRIVRLIGCLDELAVMQQNSHTHMAEDGAYLLSLFHQLQHRYTSVEQSKLYPITQLFEQTGQKLMQAFQE